MGRQAHRELPNIAIRRDKNDFERVPSQFGCFVGPCKTGRELSAWWTPVTSDLMICFVADVFLPFTSALAVDRFLALDIIFGRAYIHEVFKGSRGREH